MTAMTDEEIKLISRIGQLLAERLGCSMWSRGHATPPPYTVHLAPQNESHPAHPVRASAPTSSTNSTSVVGSGVMIGGMTRSRCLSSPFLAPQPLPPAGPDVMVRRARSSPDRAPGAAAHRLRDFETVTLNPLTPLRLAHATEYQFRHSLRLGGTPPLARNEVKTTSGFSA